MQIRFQPDFCRYFRTLQQNSVEMAVSPLAGPPAIKNIFIKQNKPSPLNVMQPWLRMSEWASAMMDCFFPHEPLKLIVEPCWNRLKLVAVWEAIKKHPSIRKHVGRQVKGAKGRKGWKVKEALWRRYAGGCCWIWAAFALTLLRWRGSPVVRLFHLTPRVSHGKSFIGAISYGLTPVL